MYAPLKTHFYAPSIPTLETLSATLREITLSAPTSVAILAQAI